MSISRFTIVGALLLLASVGCSAKMEEEDPAANSAAVTAACAGTQEQALSHYKAAVAKAKQRQNHDACSGEATLADIAAEAQKAVTTCSAFKDVIKTSVWAEPLRAQLGTSVIYPILVGDADPSNPASLSAALVGKTMYGPAPGVYGNVGLLTFEANGRGFIGILNLDDRGAPSWGRTDMRWTVESTGGVIHVKVVAEYENETETSFDFTMKKGDPMFGADNYTLELQGQPGAPDAVRSFDTYPSECEA